MIKRLFALAAFCSATAVWAQDEQLVADVSLQTVDQTATGVPSFGEKIIAVFYGDADFPDINDPLAQAIVDMKPNEKVYRGVGIANLADSKAPNFIIRSVIKGKIEKFKSTIVTDPDHSLSKAWGLGDCNNTGLVIIIGKDKKVKFMQRGAIRGADLEKVTTLLKKLIAEAEAAGATP